jgi:hypothetical protein
MKCPALCPLCDGALHGKAFVEWYDLSFHVNNHHAGFLERMYEHCPVCRAWLRRLLTQSGLIVSPNNGMEKLYRHWKNVGMEAHLLSLSLQ